MRVETIRGKGPGGQHRNVTDSTVRATHLPTGLSAIADGRDQHRNRAEALRVLANRVVRQRAAAATDATNRGRVEQITGSWVCTWTAWRDTVVHHGSGRKANMTRVLAGRFEPLVD